MSVETYTWLKAGHLIGLVLWISGLVAVYWLLRFHSHAPKDVHEKLTLQERSMALMADISAALAIGTGIAMIVGGKIFSQPKMGWFHIKLTVVALVILPVHGMLRAKIKKYGMGIMKPVPQWMWTLLLSGIVAVLILVTRVRLAFLMS